MIAAKILKPKTVFGFSLAMLISLTTANLVFITVYGFTKTLTHSLGGVGGEGILLLQEGAKSVYTSRVPLSLSHNLCTLPDVEAHAVTLTPVTISGKPIIFRGVDAFNDYHSKIMQGRLPTEQGSWVLLGREAYRRLHLEVDDIIVVGSPPAPNIVTLYIAGIYHLGGLRDYEAVVPYQVGTELAGIADGLASAIQVNGIGKEEVEPLVKSVYTLKIEHDAKNGRVEVLNLLNTQVTSFPLEEPGTKILQLPFGHYTIMYHESYLTTNLTTLFLTENQTLTLEMPNEELFQLEVATPEIDPPTLQLADGTVTQGSWTGNTWLFEAPQGLHTLKLSEAKYLIPLKGDTTFNPYTLEEAPTQIEIDVQWQDGADVTDYLLSVKDTYGALLASAKTSTSLVTLSFPEGDYIAEVSKPPYSTTVQFKVPRQGAVTVTLPRISNPGRIPPILYQQLKATTPVDASATTLTSLVGITSASLIALMTSLTVLSIIAVFTVQKSLYNSAKENLKVLWALGAEKRQVLRMIGPQTFSLNLALGLGATFLALVVHEGLFCSLTFTLFGYGLQVNPLLTLAYSLLLSITSWLLSTSELTPGNNAEA